MGQELIKRTSRPVTPMWSAEVMLHEPHLVRALHEEFIQSGAGIIILNTYTATPQRLTRDASVELLEPLHHAAKKAALDAIANSGKSDVKVAGCLPPLVASYRSEVAPDYQDCLNTYERLVELQQDVSDIFICETMSSVTEAKAACAAAKRSGKEVWVSFTVDDREPLKLRSGESVQQAAEALSKLHPDALILNCSTPEAISEALPSLRGATDFFGAYANGFTSVDSLYPGSTVESLSVRKDFTPEQYARFCLTWANQGATIIGGCCEVTPAHIRYVKETLEKNGYGIA